ncbi:MAG: metallophosphatase family protein [Proteobacteria bacterium]|nr:metallophosphatase family protein [Pseudomonadota bacterium]
MLIGLTTPLIATRILLVSDIHGNYPALLAIANELDATTFDYIINCGDSTVYAPFPNETLRWLIQHKALSILGNTDKKVINLLNNQPFTKPRKQEKRIMYSSTAKALNEAERHTLFAFGESETLILQNPAKDSAKKQLSIGIFHGSPADPDEFLFADTPDDRFHDLAAGLDCSIVVTGHSHSPYHKFISGIHFINPGSAGRMFDGDPRASCAILEIAEEIVKVRHFRIRYDITETVAAIRRQQLPEIYATMFLQGRKLN